MQDQKLVKTESGLRCPADGTLVVLVDDQDVKCMRCGRTWYAAGHVDFDFCWAGGDDPE